ncbi:hypothetical protein, conserved [Eimeria maxima]|uniref:Uncharacterized protein n=1 Tax=Eimeria maxima TaxID=5804 RepID=U6MD21_EIMMA|nr:hypothetical protein, conserved [Eimeria maxima]CDJ61936.1 hypothetical protein, conserved [Eimeria maxima]
MPQRTYGNGQASSSPSWDAKAVPISLFFQVAAWFASISVTSFGPEFASASLCAVNICNGGTCYEHGTAQTQTFPLISNASAVTSSKARIANSRLTPALVPSTLAAKALAFSLQGKAPVLSPASATTTGKLLQVSEWLLPSGATARW